MTDSLAVVLIKYNVQEVAMAIRYLVRNVWTRGWSQIPQKWRVFPSHYMFWVTTGLEYVNITHTMALSIIYFKNNVLCIFFVTTKTVNVEWVRPRERESSLESPVCNKSCDVLWNFYTVIPLVCQIFVTKRYAPWNIWQVTIGHWGLLGVL